MDANKVLSPEEAAILEQYYRSMYKRMYSFAVNYLRDHGLAEVAVQEAFCVASRKFSELQSSPNPKGWLYEALKYTMRQVKRDRQRCLERWVPLEMADEKPVEDEPGCGLDFKGNADLKLLRHFCVEGYSLSEIAKEQSCSVPAMKMKILRAKRRLRKDPDILDLKDFE